MPSDLGINSRLAALFQSIFGAITTLPDPTLYDLIAAQQAAIIELQDRIGSVPGDATTTVNGHLAAIENLMRCVCGDFPPPTTGTGACDSPATTQGGALASFSDLSGRAFPIWGDPPPSGLAIHGTGELADAGVSVELSDTTGTYSYYVQSRSASHLRTSGGTVLYPCNRWLGLSPGDVLEVSVPDAFDATVYLCYTPAAGFVDCVNVGSTESHYHNTAGNVQIDSFGAVWASIPGVTTGSAEVYAGDTYTWNDSGHVALVDGIGWTFTKNSGPDFRLLAHHPDGSFTAHTISATPLTLADHTDSLWCDGGSTGTNEEYSFQVCPPA